MIVSTKLFYVQHKLQNNFSMNRKSSKKGGNYLKIISGLSGSGKSIALRALEDLGYFCVDNLPVFLLEQFVHQVFKENGEKANLAAVSIDARNKQFLESFEQHINRLKSTGIECDVIFLYAEESVLVKRYSETRRMHPLMDEDTSLLSSIRLERKILSFISERAYRHFDTTNMSPHELRYLIQEDANEVGTSDLSMLVKSFAFKRGAPLDADFVFDVRCLPNPYWVEELKEFNGLEQPIVEYFLASPIAQKMVDHLEAFLREWIGEFRNAGRVYITVAIGCTGGWHRSVYVVEELVKRFSDSDLHIQKRHSELG